MIATALLRAYRWTIEAASQLADLESDSLDRELSATELEAFAKRCMTGYLCVVEPALTDARETGTTNEERALAWIDTARVTIARALLVIDELA